MGKFRKIRRDFNKVAHAAQDTVKYLKNNPALVNAGLMASDMIMPGSSGMIKSAYKQGKGAYNQGKGYYKQGKALKNDYELSMSEMAKERAHAAQSAAQQVQFKNDDENIQAIQDQMQKNDLEKLAL